MFKLSTGGWLKERTHQNQRKQLESSTLSSWTNNTSSEPTQLSPNSNPVLHPSHHIPAHNAGGSRLLYQRSQRFPELQDPKGHTGCQNPSRGTPLDQKTCKLPEPHSTQARKPERKQKQREKTSTQQKQKLRNQDLNLNYSKSRCLQANIR